MSQILIRGIDPQIKEALTRKAQQRGTSIEAEARLALERFTRTRSWVDNWIEETRYLKGSLELPKRSMPRKLEF
jgi:plasmid stability protein